MMKLKLRYIIPAFLLILPVSCEKERPVQIPDFASSGLMAVYESAALYRGCEEFGKSACISFSEGPSLTLSRDSVTIVNVIGTRLPVFELSKNGEWLIDGRSSGIFKTTDIDNTKSSIVCLAYDFDFLYIRLSNGEQLRIPYCEEDSLWGFSFLSEDNPVLEKDLCCTIDGRKVGGELPDRVIHNALYASLNFRGTHISVKGEPQLNRHSANLFASPVEYVLNTYGGTQIVYTVSLSEPYPTIYINTEGNKPVVSLSTYINGTITFKDPAHRYWDVDECSFPMKIRGRGNSTWGMPKKPYRIKLDEKEAVFGIARSRDWALLANYADKTLMRNTLGQEVSRVCGMSWVPEIRNVDLYMNGNYAGSYDFTEHKKVASDRVDIDVDNGDCYLEIEAKKDNPVCFDTKRMNIPIMFSDPEEPSEELLNEVRNWFDGFETALQSSYSANPDIGYAQYIDVDSFVNNFIIQELAKNIDADLFKSLFLVKRKNGKLQFYHQWDFDLAFGNCNYLNAHVNTTNGPEGWYIKNHSQEGIDTGWYHYLFQDPAFRSKVKARWIEVYPALKGLEQFIESQYNSIVGSAGRNFRIWTILDSYVWPNQVWLGDYRKEVDYMKKYYLDRLEWMNSQIIQW